MIREPTAHRELTLRTWFSFRYCAENGAPILKWITGHKSFSVFFVPLFWSETWETICYRYCFRLKNGSQMAAKYTDPIQTSSDATASSGQWTTMLSVWQEEQCSTIQATWRSQKISTWRGRGPASPDTHLRECYTRPGLLTAEDLVVEMFVFMASSVTMVK